MQELTHADLDSQWLIEQLLVKINCWKWPYRSFVIPEKMISKILAIVEACERGVDVNFIIALLDRTHDRAELPLADVLCSPLLAD